MTDCNNLLILITFCANENVEITLYLYTCSVQVSFNFMHNFVSVALLSVLIVLM